MGMWVKRKNLNLAEQQALVERELERQDSKLNFVIAIVSFLCISELALTYIVLNMR